VGASNERPRQKKPENAPGVSVERATGCRDESAARSVLADFQRRAEKVKGGILTANEAAAIDHQAAPLAEHVAAYLMKLETQGTSPDHRANVRRALDRLATDCGFRRLSDLNREALERWFVSQEKAGMGARTRNTYRAAAVAFCNWCIETGRLLSNPFAKVAKANEDVDPRRQRRAMTENELIRLLDVARRRPVGDRLIVHKGPRKGQRYAKLRPEVRRRLERLGRERALIYKTLVLTGLRKGELVSLSVGQLVLDGPVPYVVLKAADEKNREGSTVPLRADLAADLRRWLADKAQAAQDAAGDVSTVALEPKAPGHTGEAGGVLPLPPDTPVFKVPDKLVRILDRDLVAAGIARRVEVAPGKWKIDKRDERGRTVDVHALRHTFGTLLSKGGVSPRTAQAAMRHSKIDLTMNTYTDPKLLDVAGAVESLPALPLSAGTQMEPDAVSATGTDDLTPSPLVPNLVPATAKRGPLQSIVGQMTRGTAEMAGDESTAGKVFPIKQLRPLSIVDNGRSEVGDTGLEPVTPSLSS